MQIHRIHIENFGKLHDFDIEFRQGMNVLRAGNGWGKTTLAAFIKAVLYGLDYTTKRSLKENERKKYAPWQGGAFGGNMEFSAGEKRYRVERFFGVKDKKEDTFCLYDLETGLPDKDYSERLGEELFRLDRAAFERSSFFMQQDFASSANDSLNARLTHVEEAAGDMQNYEKALSSLEERMKYYQKTGNRGQLAKLLQERREVQQELERCREKEDAIPEWQKKLDENSRQKEELACAELNLEKQLEKAQEYGTKVERKERYEDFRQQIEGLGERLRQTGVELAGFSEAPPSEEMLEQCRSDIYRLKTVLNLEKEAEKGVDSAKRELENLHREEILGGAGIYLIFLSAAAGIAAFGLLASMGQVMPGAAALLVCCCISVYLGWKERGTRTRIARWEEELAAGEQKSREASLEYAKLKEERKALEKRIKRTLGEPAAGAAADALERLWKEEQRKNRKYTDLKQSYHKLEKELRDKRETFREYKGRFSEEEILEFQNLQKPQREADDLRGELADCRKRQDALLRERESLKSRIGSLSEEAERIPELEEECARLDEEYTKGEREYELLKKTVNLLEKAREQFSTRYLKDLQKGVETFLSRLEPEETYNSVVDVKLQVKLEEAGAFRELEYYSAGWQDLVQLAKRFAIADALCDGELPVLILDDPFTNLDTGKKNKALRLLEEKAEKWQIIYFTCHE